MNKTALLLLSLGVFNAAFASSPELVINEVDYDQEGTDSTEFVEIKNTGLFAVNLGKFLLELVNGNGASVYRSIALPAVTLVGGDYFVVCGDIAGMENCDFAVSPGSNLLQNGAPDAITLRRNGELIDTVSYEGDTAAPYTEGSGSGLTDDGIGDKGLLRCADGADTDQNNANFTYTKTTPGETNHCTASPQPFGACSQPATGIHDVQGNGLTSPQEDNIVTVEAVVVASFQGSNLIGGYFVQEEEADSDADPLTSEGLYVADLTNTPFVGAKVRVRGTVSETGGRTELVNLANFADCGNAAAATPVNITLPVTNVDDFERYEGMLVTFPQTLTIADSDDFDRYGEIVLTGERQFQPTARFDPRSAEAAQSAQDNLLNRITLDDGRSNQNPDPAIHPNGKTFDLNNLFRGSDKVSNVIGVMDYSSGEYRIQPVQEADFTVANPRPTQPDNVGGTVKVASFNVLNYFTTFANQGNVCGPSGDMACRGAGNAFEFNRQRDKIIAALAKIDAEVAALIEIENHPSDAAVADLVSGLNAVKGAGTYDYVPTGSLGTDAVKVALIYQPAKVTRFGPHAVLDKPSFTNPLGAAHEQNRPSLAQTFSDNSNGALFTVVVNHLRSKGSACGAGDDDPLQGNCNRTRTLAAQVLADWLTTDPTGSGDADVLLVGDLNAYAKEDPSAAIRQGADGIAGNDNDYTDLLAHFIGDKAYSYVFDGQLGYLDYALANRSLMQQVSGATVWHVNADEPDLIDYDTTFKEPAQDALYAPDAYRSSDHDPVIVGLQLAGAEPSIHDLAATKLQVPNKITLSAKKPSFTKAIKVTVQNRSQHAETLADSAILSQLITLQVESLGTCPNPEATLNVVKLAGKLPLTLQPKKLLSVDFNVTFACVNDAMAGPGHEDYRYQATVNHRAIDGENDVHSGDDICPHSVAPPYEIDPYPNGKIRDKGCGAKKSDRTLGGEVLTDIIGK